MIKFEDVKVGDRVRLVNENGDTAEITVTACNEYAVWTEFNTFRDTECWSVTEILEKQMPNKPGTIMRNEVNKTLYVRVKTHWESVTQGFKYDEETMRPWWNEGILTVEYTPE